MSISVRIVRAVPAGTITRPDTPIPVIATIHWHRGEVTEMDATALAWTANAVQVEWRTSSGLRADWIPAQHVRRVGHPPAPDQSIPRAARKNNRW
jgi:hypothetical protein